MTPHNYVPGRIHELEAVPNAGLGSINALSYHFGEQKSRPMLSKYCVLAWMYPRFLWLARPCPASAVRLLVQPKLSSNFPIDWSVNKVRSARPDRDPMSERRGDLCHSAVDYNSCRLKCWEEWAFNCHPIWTRVAQRGFSRSMGQRLFPPASYLYAPRERELKQGIEVSVPPNRQSVFCKR